MVNSPNNNETPAVAEPEANKEERGKTVPSSTAKIKADNEQEINDVSREFNLSLSITDNSDAPVDDTISHPMSPSENQTKSIEIALTSEQIEDKRFISPKDFELLKVIGMGAFGKVLQVRNRQSSQILAMKVISKRLIKRKTSYVENVLAERNILTKIANHPFIVTMHASFQTKEKLFIIMDFCAGGELFLKLGREGIFRERTAAFYLAEITLALEHLHSVNVLHRDLKPENILLNSDGHCVLTDFGLAKDFTGNNNENEDERARTLCGTMEYMAPEMVARKWYGKGADFWSLGCIAFEMLSGQPPFCSGRGGSKELFRKIMNERIRMPEGSSASACKLLKGLLNRDVNKRLGAAKGTMFEVGGVGALKQQLFFAGLDWGKLELKEIQPPEDFSVSNDEDLRHFHEEFTKMTLPRSVKEMSQQSFLPRHCKSDHFRGFSFIGDHFPLPQRTNSEEMHYWNNPDGDGQSLSDCASDIFDDDMKDDISHEPEPTPEKKKRPPRKKKKKQTIPLETAEEGDERDELAVPERDRESKPSVQAEHADNVVSSDNLSSTDQYNNPISVNIKSTKSIQEGPDLPQASSPINKIISPAPKNNVNATISINRNSHIGTTRLQSVHISPALKASSVTAIRTPWATTQTNSNRQPTPAIVHTQNTKEHVVIDTYKPKSGTWASIAVKKDTTTIHHGSNPALTRPTPTAKSTIPTPLTHSKLPPRQGQNNSDWRNHVVSPNRNLRDRTAMRNMNVKNTSSSSPPSVSQPKKTWSSLDEFGPPLGSTEEAQKKSKPVGAWGLKS